MRASDAQAVRDTRWRRRLRRLAVYAVIVALTGAAGWLYDGPSLRVQSVTVLGGTARERSLAAGRLLAILGGRHIWSVSIDAVTNRFSSERVLGAEVRLHMLATRWPSSVEAELSEIPPVGYLKDGYALTGTGAVIAGKPPGPGPSISLCPLVLTAMAANCPWQPEVGDVVPARFAAVVGALWRDRVPKESGEAIAVGEVPRSGIVIGLPGSAECLLGSGVLARAEVNACTRFSAPGAVVDVINPNSPAVLLNDRVG
ncbi:hypothetical protein [Ferrimicrobium sp.]|uniref:hypothetical protein n=1 Tax=Ferrimicrobium sp. TaxID=2926050 RepID=UPI00263055A9|nr:hypothetical protein [Ferrimicrobium sp.]